MVPNAVYKLLSKHFAPKLTTVLNEIRAENKLPKHFLEGDISVLYKKGASCSCTQASKLDRIAAAACPSAACRSAAQTDAISFLSPPPSSSTTLAPWQPSPALNMLCYVLLLLHNYLWTCRYKWLNYR